MTVVEDKIPRELRDVPQWVVWDDQKVPFNPTTGEPAKAGQPDTWGTYEDACALFDRGGYSGVGYEFLDDDTIFGIDLDGCRNPETGELADWARKIIETVGSYAEVSPSYTGVKIFARGRSPWTSGKVFPLDVDKVSDKGPAVEVYDRRRYFCVTGLPLPDFEELADVPQDVIRQLVDELPTRRKLDDKPKANTTNLSALANDQSLEQRAAAYVKAVDVAGEGNRNNSAFNLAGNLFAFVDDDGRRLGQSQVLKLVRKWNSRLGEPLPAAEIERVVASAERNGTPRVDKPTLASRTPDAAGLSNHLRPNEAENPPHPEGKTDEKTHSGVVPQFVSAAQLVVDWPHETEPIIDGYLRRAESSNIIASPKVGKSWLSLGLAMSIATGADWLGHPVRPGKVLLIDNELRRATSASRLRRVAVAMGINLNDVGDSLAVENLRGRLTNLHAMGPYFKKLESHDFDLIILDALYRFFPGDASENDQTAFTQLYNAIDGHAEELGCAFICVHHSTKGDQSQKAVTDVGSGAGSQSRAVDSHIILRPHELADMAVLEGAVRSFPPPAPLSIKWDFPLWIAKPAIEPEVRMPKTFNEKKHAANDKEGIHEILKFMRERNEPISSSQCRSLMGTDRAARLFRIAGHEGLIEFVRQDKRGGKMVDLYKPVEGVTDD